MVLGHEDGNITVNDIYDKSTNTELNAYDDVVNNVHFF